MRFDYHMLNYATFVLGYFLFSISVEPRNKGKNFLFALIDSRWISAAVQTTRRQ